MTLNKHHLATKMLTKAFTAYTEVLRKYIGFNKTSDSITPFHKSHVLYYYKKVGAVI